MEEIHLCQNYITYAFSSSLRAGRSFELWVESWNSLRSFEFLWELQVESRNSLRSFKFLWDFVEFQAFPWDFQSILSKHKGLHEGHGNCVSFYKSSSMKDNFTQVGARGSKHESKYLHSCSLASSASTVTFVTLACV